MKRRQVSRLYLTASEALDGVDRIRAELHAMDEAEQNPDAGPVTVDMACDRWLAAKDGKVRSNTLESYRFALLPVRRYMGDRDVTALVPTDVEGFARWISREGGKRGQGLGTHASRSALAALSGVLDRAHKVERITSENVMRAADVRLPSVVAPADEDSDESDDLLERWSEVEWRTFVDHADSDPMAVGWRLLALGLRREEVLVLRWRDVDFEAGTLSIRQTRVQVSTDPRGWTLGLPKSKASRRTIRPDSVMPGTLEKLRQVRGVGSRLVVVDSLGEPPAPRWFSKRFTRVCVAAGVPVIHAHSTRHTLAYFMSEKGIPAVNAAAYLGHTTSVFTNIYLRHKVEGVAAAEDALGAVYATASQA
jgi:integrase